MYKTSILFRLIVRTMISSIFVGLITVSEAQNLAYVALIGDDKLAVIDMSAGSELIQLDVGDQPRGVTLNGDGSEIWVTIKEEDVVKVIDANTYTVLATIPTGAEPYGVALNPDDTKAYVANPLDSTVAVIDAIHYTVITTLPTDAESTQPLVTFDGKKVFIPNRDLGARTLTVIDGETDTLITNLNIGVEPYSLALSPSGDTLYLADRGGRRVYLIDVETLATLKTISTSPHKNVGAALSADGRILYTASFQQNAVIGVDILGDSVKYVIPVGNRPWGVSRSRDGNFIISADWYSDQVSIISTASNSVIGTVSTGRDPVGFGDFTGYIHSDFLFPVEWLHFGGRLAGRKVQLSWSTASEVNNYGFEIERSIQPNQWEQIGFVSGKGAENRGATYQFVDVLTPGSLETYIYRLRQLDLDGSIHFSQTIEVKTDLVVNGPALRSTHFTDYLSLEAEAGQLSIFNTLGNEVLRTPVTAGQNEVSTAHMPSGWYWVIHTNIKGDQHTFKVRKVE